MSLPLSAIALAVALSLLAVLVRLAYVLPATRQPLKRSNGPFTGALPASIHILLGSGGHSGEMLRMVKNMKLEMCKRTWIYTSGDLTSLGRVQAFEDGVQKPGSENPKPAFFELKRARRVGQSYFSSVFTTLASMLAAFMFAFTTPPPEILLINGPGTCVPLAYALFALKFAGLGKTRIIYVESLARVSSLSLTGRLVLPISDRFVVQWRQLAEKFQRAEYHGILV